jgi:hypothetical protein
MMLKRSLLACFLLGGIAACNNNVPSSPNYGESGGTSTSSTGGNAGSGGHSDSGGSGGVSMASGGAAGSSTGGGGTATARGGAVTETGGTGSGGLVGHGGTIGSGGAAAGSGGSGGSSTGRDAGADAVSAVSYSKQIAPMLKSSCTSCHTGAASPRGVDLGTYAGVKANLTAANSAIQGGSMPPSGPLSGTNKQLFQSWVNQGAPNN